MNIEQSRLNMIEQQIRPWGVLDAQVLDTLTQIKREQFVPEAHRALAFVDMEVPLGDLSLGQSMLAPRVEARLLQDLKLQAHEKVLEIGAGSGHMAALMSRLARHVLTLDVVPQMVEMARAHLQKAGVSNVEVRQADGSVPEDLGGEFDVIVFSGSVAQLPQAWLARLPVGGRLAGFVGEAPMMRATIVRCLCAGHFETREPWDTVVPRLRGFAENPIFNFDA